MSNPLVSVIMPVYNGEQFLRLALDSVFAQNYRPLDIIVVDDGSTDHTADIACSFKGVRYFYQENQGDGLARNHGIAQAQGDFISFLDADDLWTPHKTHVQIEYLKKKADIDCVFSFMKNFLQPGFEEPSWLKGEQLHKAVPARLLPTMLARKMVFEKVGLFDSYYMSSDTEWLFRARDKGITSVMLDEVVLYRRIHGANISRQVKTMNLELKHLIRASLKRRRDKKN